MTRWSGRRCGRRCRRPARRVPRPGQAGVRDLHLRVDRRAEGRAGHARGAGELLAGWRAATSGPADRVRWLSVASPSFDVFDRGCGPGAVRRRGCWCWATRRARPIRAGAGPGCWPQRGRRAASARLATLDALAAHLRGRRIAAAGAAAGGGERRTCGGRRAAARAARGAGPGVRLLTATGRPRRRSTPRSACCGAVPGPDGPVPVGWPLPGTRVYVLDG